VRLQLERIGWLWAALRTCVDRIAPFGGGSKKTQFDFYFLYA